MKKLLLLLLLSVSVIAAYSQTNTYGGGYRGFADLGYTAGVGDYNFGRFEISTTHGYQINPHFFVGGGVGFHFMSSYETKGMSVPLDKRDAKTSLPLFVDFRGTFTKRKFAPFLDLKLGYFVTNGDGFYGNLSAGCRMALKGKQALSLSLGYTYEQLEFQVFRRFVSSSSLSAIRVPTKRACEGISIKLGYEF